MNHNEMERRNNQQMAEHRCETTVAGTAWKIVGGAALALVAAAVIVSLPDIKRYIRISTM
jgi:hypothetical protein